MRLFEIIIEPLSDFITPWQADTLFGHIAWSVRYEEGESGIEAWLQRFRRPQPEIDGQAFEPPFCLSDGFITGWLPRPMLPPRKRQTSLLSLEEAIKAKRRKNMKWLHVDAFKNWNYDDETQLSAAGDFKRRVTMHNTIDRRTMTSLEEDGLYSQEQRTLHGREESTISIFAKATENRDQELLLYHLGRIAESGYGKRKSIGMGQFRIAEVIDRSEMFSTLAKNANAEMWISHGVPAQDDPLDGYYKIDTKYGKLGEGVNYFGHPFKKPLTRIVPGSVFFLKGSYRGWNGQLVEGILESNPKVVQYGYALTIPIQLKGDDYETISDCYVGGE